MKPLVYPTVNLNGNSAEDLLAKTMNVIKATEALKQALSEASDLSHGRNFQHLIKGNDWSDHHIEVREAQNAMAERYRMVNDLGHEFTNLALDIQRQQRERKRA